MDMMAAGTSEPMPMAEKASTTNQEGKLCSNSGGTAKLLPNCLNPAANCGKRSTPAASAKKPSSASSPSTTVKLGSSAALRRTALRLLALKNAVMLCG